MDSCNKSKDFYLSLELGGTTLKALLIQTNIYISTPIDGIIAKSKIIKVKTNDCPEETLTLLTSEIKSFFDNEKGKILKVGIGSFGPICINTNDHKYGYILSSPKKGWHMFDLLGCLEKYLNIDKKLFFFQTDVNACAQLEYKFGNHNKSSIAYITIGNGCGIGIINQGNILKGLQHTEGGHIYINKHIKDNDFKGVCMYNKECAEG